MFIDKVYRKKDFMNVKHGIVMPQLIYAHNKDANIFL